MGRPFSRQGELSQIRFFPAHPGSRAVFMIEARTKKEMKQVRELFDMVGQLAEVVPVSHGAIMSYAVQLQGDTTLFGKIEWLVKTQFTFSVVERNFTDVTFRLVKSLCEDSKAQLGELPECGICSSVDPFPTRATVEVKEQPEPLHVAYCSRCSALYAEEAPERFIRNLIRRDQRSFRVPADVPVTLMPEMVEEKPEWEVDVLAIAG
jgi:hypothetical protein